MSILLKYGTSMEPAEIKRSSVESVAKRPFIRFQELIFCSLYAVALEITSKENVFRVMRSVFHCDAQPKALRGRIRGAKWANRVIYLLSRTSWGSCSWDVIYVGYELSDYKELDLSGLEKLLVVPANIGPNETEPTSAGPKDTTLSMKRKGVQITTFPKR
ncbi:uncharacterized protein N7500_008700 [Penicillium coprophilum]|uniref:uncharacterized protein n=1 Tax=Penicillium coprophilum TaxID=36646 RepID=UPI00239F6B42|nr:uncharacterized protein N7500_008700 [Penicillium coprophilum]KAJ5159049.1 hypothetical protein N7500_008700 [Penicillium coprophilum]